MKKRMYMTAESMGAGDTAETVFSAASKPVKGWVGNDHNIKHYPVGPGGQIYYDPNANAAGPTVGPGQSAATPTPYPTAAMATTAIASAFNANNPQAMYSAVNSLRQIPAYAYHPYVQNAVNAYYQNQNYENAQALNNIMMSYPIEPNQYAQYAQQYSAPIQDEGAYDGSEAEAEQEEMQYESDMGELND